MSQFKTLTNHNGAANTKIVTNVRASKYRKIHLQGQSKTNSQILSAPLLNKFAPAKIRNINPLNLVVLLVDEKLDSVVPESNVSIKTSTAQRIFSNFRKTN